ncbi:cbb3-type cytochrome c oxidase subunit 3 [Sphingobium cloacae]|uniref:cbb3-type cytochrome c oxidase subunit 3 n=1 Tax=Sphingobium cloacae TaxID=120107 RepID=UPI00082C3FA4|nr:cbb3-type cytochrome c oxidase subunit 3 [Sphingobium cloacae]
MNYNELRHFADSWGLVAMTVVYLVLIGWTFLPKGRERGDEAARMIFDSENENRDADHG